MEDNLGVNLDDGRFEVPTWPAAQCTEWAQNHERDGQWHRGYARSKLGPPLRPCSPQSTKSGSPSSVRKAVAKQSRLVSSRTAGGTLDTVPALVSLLQLPS